MNIYTHISPGKYHPTHGEDFHFHQFVGGNWLIAAVMDGCSSGKESFFASASYGKSLRKTCRILPQMKEIDPGFDLETIRKEELVIFILRQLFSDIKKQQRLLVLDIEEILSTMILMVHDLNNHSAWINVSGDGIIVCDGDLTEIDQENIPDYMGYYMDETFGDWYGDHTRNLQLSGIRDISISTDGIRKLRTEDSGQDRLIDPVDYLLLQDPGDAGENFLTERYLELTRQRGYVPVDDMSIIRVIP